MPPHPPFRSPSMPCGRTSRTTIRIDQGAGTFFSSIGTTEQRSTARRAAPTTKPRRGRRRVAEPAERDAGEHQEQQREAHVPRDLLVEAEEDAAEAGEGAADDPHEQDHPSVSMPVADARSGLSEHGADRLAERRPLQEERHADEHDHAQVGDQVARGDVIGPMSTASCTA